jgi:phosphoglycolate phosphatase
MGAETSEQAIEDAVLLFFNFYRQHALANTRLYPGISDVVKELGRLGHTLAVLTNKPVKISTDIVAGLGLGSQFMRVYGGDSFAQKKPDPVGILTLLEETTSLPENTWMVGDSGVDIQTARNAHVRACGVAWGFQPETFEKHPPDVLVAKPEELVRIVSEEKN